MSEVIASLVDLADDNTGVLYAMYWWLLFAATRLVEFDLNPVQLDRESAVYEVLLARATDSFSRLFERMCRSVPKVLKLFTILPFS